LGIDLGQIAPHELKFVNRLAYRAISDGGLWGEAEIDYIFILRKNLALNPNPEEVQSVRYVTKEEMKDLLKNQQKYDMKITPWVKLLANNFLFSYWDNLDNLDKIAQPKFIVYYRDLLPTR
jgi:isopentenyl-diphosphate delta-isomerase